MRRADAQMQLPVKIALLHAHRSCNFVDNEAVGRLEELPTPESERPIRAALASKVDAMEEVLKQERCRVAQEGEEAQAAQEEACAAASHQTAMRTLNERIAHAEEARSRAQQLLHFNTDVL